MITLLLAVALIALLVHLLGIPRDVARVVYVVLLVIVGIVLVRGGL